MPHTKNLPNKFAVYLKLVEIIAAHKALIDRYGGSLGIRDQGLLESAVFRPHATVFGQDAYPDLLEKCAVLGFSLIQNHPFVDGNKRVGFAAMHLMLLMNGYDLTADYNEAIKMIEKVAQGKLKEFEVAEWIKGHIKKRDCGPTFDQQK